MNVASVRKHMTKKHSTQLQAVKLLANILTLDEGRKCSQLNTVVGFVIEWQLQIDELPREIAMYRRSFNGLFSGKRPTAKDNTRKESKAIKMPFGRKQNSELVN